MDDLTKLLDGSIDDVKTRLDGKSNDDLLKLKAAEQAGQNRKGVLSLLDHAIETSNAQRAGGVVQMQPGAEHSTVAADFDTSGAAEVAPATDFSPSGAPRQVTDIDVDHPAVDNDPRAGTTANQNRIDFNDPVKPGHEVVEQQLKDQASA